MAIRRVLAPALKEAAAVRSRTKLLGACIAGAALLIAGCAHHPHLAWPWHAKAPPAPKPVEVVVISAEDGVLVRAFPQYIERNTLLVDLSGAANTGTIVLTRRGGAAWPVRLAFRVRPTEVKSLEVQAAQRLILPTSTEAGDTVELSVTPGVYRQDTQSIRVHW